MTHEELQGKIEALETELAAARQKVEVEHDKYLRAWHHRCKAMSERDEARADLAAAIKERDEARAKALEECAKAADKAHNAQGEPVTAAQRGAAQISFEIAAAIRALAQPQDGEGK